MMVLPFQTFRRKLSMVPPTERVPGIGIMNNPENNKRYGKYNKIEPDP